MRFIYQYPDRQGTEGDLLDAGPVAEVAARAEAAGWHGLSFTEHPAPPARWLAAGGHQTLDPFVALGHAAATTSRLKLLTYLAVGPYRNPSMLAKTAATVDKLSDGRFVLGLGTGYQKSEFFAVGAEFDERNASLEEALDVLPLHWRGEPFSYTGRHFEARDVIARPRPVQQPIPIWIGGNAKVTLRRVAERAQGWMPLLGPPTLSTTARTAPITTVDELAAKVADLRSLAGDRPLDIVVPYLDPTIATPDRDGARHREAFDRLAEIGATWVVVSSASTSPDTTFAFLDAFGAAHLSGASSPGSQ